MQSLMPRVCVRQSLSECRWTICKGCLRFSRQHRLVVVCMPRSQAKDWDSYYLVEALLQSCSAAKIAARKASSIYIRIQSMHDLCAIDAGFARHTPVQICVQQEGGHQSVRGNPCPLCGILHDDPSCSLQSHVQQVPLAEHEAEVAMMSIIRNCHCTRRCQLRKLVNCVGDDGLQSLD